VLIVFTVSSFEFQQSDCLDFISNDEWSHSSNLNTLDYQLWGQCWSLHFSDKCTRSQKQFPKF